MLILFIMARKSLNKRKINKVVNLVAVGKLEDKKIAKVSGVSISSVYNIKKSNSEKIQQLKEKYIKLIDKSTGGDTKQADILANILKAKTEIYNFKGDIVGVRDDYKIQLEGIKYIDRLKGREQPSIKLNQTNNYISKELDKYIS